MKRIFAFITHLLIFIPGADLLKLTRDDVIQICGPADGIRLFNALKGRMVRPRLTIYVCQESLQLREQQQQQQNQQKHEDGDSNGTFFDDTELSGRSLFYSGHNESRNQ